MAVAGWGDEFEAEIHFEGVIGVVGLGFEAEGEFDFFKLAHGCGGKFHRQEAVGLGKLGTGCGNERGQAQSNGEQGGAWFHGLRMAVWLGKTRLVLGRLFCRFDFPRPKYTNEICELDRNEYFVSRMRTITESLGANVS